MKREGIHSTRKAAEYLVSQGYPCSHTTMANAVKDGRLVKNAEGCYTPESLTTFAVAHLTPLGGESIDQKVTRLAREKAEHETQEAKARAEERTIKVSRLKGELVERSRMVKELAARAIVLRSDFEAWSHELPLRVVKRYHLPAEALGDLRELVLQAGKEWFAKYADTTRYVTPLLGIEDEDDALD